MEELKHEDFSSSASTEASYEGESVFEMLEN